MQLATFAAVLFTTIARTDLVGLHIEIPKPHDSYLIDTTVRALTSCYGREAETVGLAGNGQSAGVLFTTLPFRSKLASILIDNTERTVNTSLPFPGGDHKLKVFVVEASSSAQLKKIIKEIKLSLWWNHMASFFILGNKFNEECGRSKAFELLWTAWEMNLLNSKFMCDHPTNGRLMYSYNPYTCWAPEPWQLVNTYVPSDTSHPWTLFVREYPASDRMCDKLDFDKTKDLGGYSIRSTAKEFPQVWHTDRNKTGLDRFGGSNGIWAQIIFGTLNATLSLKLHSPALPGLDDSLGNDIAMDTANGVSDVLLLTRYQATVHNFTTSYTCHESGLSVVTQYSEEMSQLSKFISVLDRSSRVCVCLIVTITVIFFKFFQRQSLMTAMLNTLRISCNSSLPRLPRKVAPRIYLTGVFLLAVTILAIYEGQFASLLTKPIRLPNVNTMEDLAEQGHWVHGHHTYARFFNDSAFEGRFLEHDNYDCVEHVVRDPSAACVMDRGVLITKASERKLYMSKTIIVKLYAVYVIRKDWPLEDRFNIIIRTLTESGIIRYTIDKDIERPLSVTKYYEDLAKKRKFKTITLDQLAFAFAILGVGLLCASTAFVVEMTIKRFISTQLMPSCTSKILVNLSERVCTSIVQKN